MLNKLFSIIKTLAEIGEEVASAQKYFPKDELYDPSGDDDLFGNKSTDVNKGVKIFQDKCSKCHTTEQDAQQEKGPNLNEILGISTANKQKRADLIPNFPTKTK